MSSPCRQTLVRRLWSVIASPIAVIALAGVTLAGICGAVKQGDNAQAHVAQAKEAKVDLHGDPLPEGALARLGTVRWRHGNWVLFAAFLADGKSVVSVASDGLIRVWSFPDGKEIRRFGKIRGGAYIQQDAVAISRDGRVLATKFGGVEVHCYEVETGKLLATIDSKGDKSRVYAIALSPNGKRLAVKWWNGALEVYDLALSKEILKVPPPEAGKRSLVQNWLSYSPDGKWIMDLCAPTKQESSHYLRIIRAESGALVREIPVPDHEGFIRPPVLASDGKSVAVPVRMPSIKKDPQAKKEPRYDTSLFDLETGKELAKVYTGLGAGVFSPDGTKFYSREILAGGVKASVREFDVASGAEVRNLGEFPPWRKPAGPAGITPQQLAISPHGDILAYFGTHQSLQFFDVKTGKELATDACHFTPPLSLHFTEEGKQLITQGSDLVAMKWDAASGKLLGVIDQHKIPQFYSASTISPDGKLFWAQMYGLVKGSAGFFDVATCKELGVFPIPDQDLGSYGNAVFSPDGKLAAIRWEGASRIELRETPSAKLLEIFQSSLLRRKNAKDAMAETFPKRFSFRRTARGW